MTARSTVRRDGNRVWVEDVQMMRLFGWWCRWWILGGRIIYGVNEAVTGMVLRRLEKSRVV
ncbi:unnamed protein product [Prunus brigantina]